VHRAWAIAPFIAAGCAAIGSYIAVDELLKHHPQVLETIATP